MKKLLTLVIALVMVLTLAGCQYLPEDMQASIEDFKNSIFGNDIEEPNENIDDTNDDTNEEPEHVHDFVVYESKKAFCAKDGYAKSKCSTCGETKEEVIPALGHDIQYHSTTQPNCLKPGAVKYNCTRCSKSETTEIPALGHDWGEFVETSRLICCNRPGCNKSQITEGNGKYADSLKFTFGEIEKNILNEKHNTLAAILENAEKYDSTLHAYAEEGELADAYAAAEKIYEEYSDLIFEAQGQYTIAMTLYYCDHTNKDLEKTYNDMMDYYTELVANFYSLSQPWYDSMFREFFFYGATEEEIKAFLFDSNAYANEEYTALKNRNDAIELEFNAISNASISTAVPTLYFEFVQNNNRMAEILGYDNYLEYAYENVYDRDYTYQDVAKFVEYVKQYISPTYNSLYSDWGTITSGNLTEDEIDEYYSIVSESFFHNPTTNKIFNDYIDDMNMAFTSNPDKQYSFSDSLNDLMGDGNLFRGSYAGAYVSYVRGINIPIAYFGSGYDSATTVAHEFGHYMNEIYNEDLSSQSFDLLETHSQGQEMLFIYYAKQHLSETGVDLVETYQLLSTIQTVMLAVQVDCFEQAVYLDYYDGPGSEEIMADNTITADEYDALYAGLSEYLGIDEAYRIDEYWRNVVINSPCYYISYSISAINALQLYVKANDEGFDAAKDSYLKLFTYSDVDEEMNLNEVLDYAGLLSYTEEATYRRIYAYVGKR